MRTVIALALLGMVACVTAPSGGETVDVLDYVLGTADTWPRHGNPNHYQHQHVEADRVCWTKYTLPWSYECWRWDDAYVYHQVDHAVDGNRRWEHYIFSDGRWLPRRLVKNEIWSLDLLDNRLTWFDANCDRADERPAPYRVRAWYEGVIDVGGDLGIRDVIVLSYQPDPEHAGPNTGEHFYFAKDAGWYRWTRGLADVTFNRLGGVAREPTPLCARDFQG